MPSFSHIDEHGQPTMVDISGKAVSRREALASSTVILGAEILQQLQSESWNSSKGPVFQTAILAGIQGAKKTSELIPLCHPLPLTQCEITIEPTGEDRVEVLCRVRTDHKTGVEMEALTGASIAALTLYDMCKAISHNIQIMDTKLLEKSGGKSGFNRDKQ